MAEAEFPLLRTIDSPADLRQLSEEDLPRLTTELRDYLIHSLDQCGGHFAANLGTVELTIALHYIFNTPHDRLIWDVGHQAYPHKVLTGRRDRLNTVKQFNGLAPFPRRSESPYDCFGTGHASTSISAALGMALANELDGSDRKIVAVIGDGALTGGMAFEALNHAGALKTDLIVILNDNDISISHNPSGLTNYLTRMLTNPVLNKFREGGKKVLEKLPPMREFAKRTEMHMKGLVSPPGMLFEELGFNYIGPMDGHDLPALLRTLRYVGEREGPQLLHIITTKGKGYAPAEEDQVRYHAVTPGFHSGGDMKETAPPPKKTAKSPTYSDVFGEWLCDVAAQDERLVAITPAMCEGSGMTRFAREFTERYHDVNIAEQHAVTLAAGLACEGKKPVVTIYSTFLQRAFDQVIHDVCLQNLDVTFAIDRAGIVGEDGPTHSGRFDLSYLRCIPNMIVMAPADEAECRRMLTTAYNHPGPAAVRYPRGAGPGAKVEGPLQSIPIGEAQILRRGQGVALLAFGSMVAPALEAAEALDATVVNMRFIKPIDEKRIAELASEHTLLVTIEENTLVGGAGSAVNDALTKINAQCRTLNLGLPDRFLEHGSRTLMLAEAGLDAKGIEESVIRHQKQPEKMPIN